MAQYLSAPSIILYIQKHANRYLGTGNTSSKAQSWLVQTTSLLFLQLIPGHAQANRHSSRFSHLKILRKQAASFCARAQSWLTSSKILWWGRRWLWERPCMQETLLSCRLWESLRCLLSWCRRLELRRDMTGVFVGSVRSEGGLPAKGHFPRRSKAASMGQDVLGHYFDVLPWTNCDVVPCYCAQKFQRQPSLKDGMFCPRGQWVPTYLWWEIFCSLILPFLNTISCVSVLPDILSRLCDA